MKVLHVIANMSPESGGPVMTLQNLTQALAHEDVHCQIFTTCGNGSDASTTLDSHVLIYRFEPGLLAYVWNAYSKKLAAALWNRLEDHTFDLVHVHEPWHYPGFAAFRAARNHKVPYVLTLHGTLDEWCLQHKRLKKFIYLKLIQDHIIKSSDTLHAHTCAEKARISNLGYKTPVFVVPCGIDLASFDELPERSEFLATYPSLSGKRVILFMGRLHSKKGLDVLARSYVSLSQKFEDTALLIVGPNEGDTQKRIESILKTSPAFPRTVFTGMLTGKNKLAALASADLFVLPSYSEGFSRAVLESLAAGLPVVISRQCNFPEVSEYNAGFVVEPDPASVTRAVTALLSNDRLRVRMGHNGRKLVREKYSSRRVAASMADLYRTLIGSRPR